MTGQARIEKENGLKDRAVYSIVERPLWPLHGSMQANFKILLKNTSSESLNYSISLFFVIPNESEQYSSEEGSLLGSWKDALKTRSKNGINFSEIS